MICVALSDMDFDRCMVLTENEPFVEFRFDLLDFSIGQVEKLVSTAQRCVATYRPDDADPDRRMQTLMAALRAGADYIDIELEADSYTRKQLIKAARDYGRDVIISYHNFDHTPPYPQLKKIFASCRKLGADVVKIACKAKYEKDVGSLLGLYQEDGRMVVIGMGNVGLITRIVAPLAGAEFTFASAEKGKETAPGQLTRAELSNLIDQVKYPYVREQFNKKYQL